GGTSVAAGAKYVAGTGGSKSTEYNCSYASSFNATKPAPAASATCAWTDPAATQDCAGARASVAYSSSSGSATRTRIGPDLSTGFRVSVRPVCHRLCQVSDQVQPNTGRSRLGF